MGGTYAGVWGALSDRVIPVPQYGVEAAGRWVAVGVRGRSPTAKIAFVSVYRPPGGLGGDGANLVKRYSRLFNVTTAEEVHSRFYADLEGWLATLRDNGFEVCVGGDFNADLDRDRTNNRGSGVTLGEWVTAAELSPLQQGDATYYGGLRDGGRSSSRIDHVAVSAGGKEWWEVGSSNLLSGREFGHRVVLHQGGCVGYVPRDGGLG